MFARYFDISMPRCLNTSMPQLPQMPEMLLRAASHRKVQISIGVVARHEQKQMTFAASLVDDGSPNASSVGSEPSKTWLRRRRSTSLVAAAAGSRQAGRQQAGSRQASSQRQRFLRNQLTSTPSQQR